MERNLKKAREFVTMLDYLGRGLKENEKMEIFTVTALIDSNGYTEEIIKNLGDRNVINRILNEIGEKKGLSLDYLKNSNIFLSSKIKDETMYNIFSKVAEFKIEDDWKYVFEEVVNILAERSLEYAQITPKYLSELGVGLIDPVGGSFVDYSCGTCSILGTAREYVDKKGGELKIYGQDINNEFAQLGKIRLSMMGIDDVEIEVGNSLVEPKFVEDGKLKKFDSVMMNAPMSMEWKNERVEVEADFYNMFRYGKPSVSSSELLFVSEGIESLKEDGKGVFVLSSGSLFRGGSESEMRKNLIRQDIIEAVISLPSILKNARIPINILVINKNKDESLKNKILLINATSMYKTERRQKVLTDEEINKILDIYRNKKEIDQVSEIINAGDIVDGNILPSSIITVREVENEKFGKIKFNKKELDNLKKGKKLEDIAEFYRGINITGKNVEENQDGDYKIINLSDVNDGKLDIDSLKKYTLKNNARTEAYKVKAGDILISNRGVNIKVSTVPEHEGEILLSQNFIGVRLKTDDNAEYIKYFLESPLGQFLLSDIQAGTNIPTINQKDLRNVPVVLTEIEKQNEIVENYKTVQKELEEQKKEIENKTKEIELELYNDMGIMSTFDIL